MVDAEELPQACSEEQTTSRCKHLCLLPPNPPTTGSSQDTDIKNVFFFFNLLSRMDMILLLSFLSLNCILLERGKEWFF